MSKYTFRKSTDEEIKENLTGFDEWIYGLVPEGIFALFFGKVRSRFGVNNSISTDWKWMYSYPVTVEDENGNKFFCRIYHGVGGSSIATPFEELTSEYEMAKNALIEYIESSKHVDYVWEGVYKDSFYENIPVNITYTVKDGKVRVDSEFPAEVRKIMSKYTFRNSTDEEIKENLTGYGEWIYSIVPEGIFALFFGKVRSRFGVNNSISTDWKWMYSYPVTVEDENGNKFFFRVYHGAGEPSIATPLETLTPEYEMAKNALIEYVESAEPVDYVWEGVYKDILYDNIPVNVTYTVKNGKTRVDSEFPEGMYDGGDIENFM